MNRLFKYSYSLLTMLLLVSCGKQVNKVETIYNENEDFTAVTESLVSCKEASIVYSIKDNGVEVYKSEKTVVVDSKEITTTTTTLNEKFTPVTKTTSNISSTFTTDDLFTYTLNKTYFDFTLYSDGKITGIVKKDQASKLFNVESFDSINSPSLTLSFNGDNFTSYEVSYNTESSKTVTISASYAY